MVPDAPDPDDKEHYADVVNALIDQMKISSIPELTKDNIMTVESFKKAAKKQKWSSNQLGDEIVKQLKPDLEIAIRDSRKTKAKLASVKKVDKEAVVAAVQEGPAAKMAKE